MMRATVPAALLLGALLALPGSARAQGQSCDVDANEFRRREIRPNQFMLQWYGNVRFECADGVSLEADTATYYDWNGETNFVGRVRYSDGRQTLTADYAMRRSWDESLVAYGNVTLSDNETGAVIRGSEFQHWAESESRSEALSIVRGGRPTADIPASRSGGASRGGEPVNVVADSMYIHGDRLFRAVGSVVVTRGDARGSSRSALFRLDDDGMVLQGEAWFQAQGYTIIGDTVQAWLDEGEPREVIAYPAASITSDSIEVRGDSIHTILEAGDPREMRVFREARARLPNDDVQVEAERLQLTFENGELSLLRAVGPARGTAGAASADGAPTAVRGRATSPPPRGREQSTNDAESPPDPFAGLARVGVREYFVAGDSVEAVAPGGQLQELWAIGNALVEQRLPETPASASKDTAAVGDDAADAADTSGPLADSASAKPRVQALPEVLANDWVAGDTVVAYFVVPGSAPDTVAASGAGDAAPEDVSRAANAGAPGSDSGRDAPARQLDRLAAVGTENTPASAVYRVTTADAGTVIHYLVASRIDLTFRNGTVARADAAGPVRGRSFQPNVTFRPVQTEP